MSRTRRAGLPAFLLAVLYLTGCGPEPALLWPLEEDPMGTVVIPGTHVENELERAGGFGATGSAPALILRSFSLGRLRSEDVLAQAARFAEAHGWTRDKWDTTSYRASKQIDYVRAELVVGVGPHLSTTGPYEVEDDHLYIALTGYKSSARTRSESGRGG